VTHPGTAIVPRVARPRERDYFIVQQLVNVHQPQRNQSAEREESRARVDSRRSLRHPSTRALPDGLAPEARALRATPSTPDVARLHAHTAERVLVAMLYNVHETVFAASLGEALPR
jgi:hypothetical protein